jgi:peptide/nickel transport system permease protein
MLSYILRRILLMIPTLILISMISFVIIQLPPGDYLTTYVIQLEQSGQKVDESERASLEKRYGLGQPIYVQYFKWISGFPRGDFGESFGWNQPVGKLVGERLALTVVISFVTLLFTWGLAIPIGIYSATHQYSIFDYVLTLLGFIGLATPDFLLALIFMFISFYYFGGGVGGLFSHEFVEAPWSIAKVVDLLRHLWIPVIVLGLSGTAGVIRVMRGNLLDELHKPYVITARAKGLTERKLTFKYPVRVAINPLISTAGWLLPSLVSGATIVSVVLSLPTTGPLLLRALLSQDMYLAGTFIMLLAFLTVIGTFISDVLLAWVDPRIRFEGR